VIALGVMAAAVLGYAGFSWLGHGGGSPPPAAAAAPHPVDPKPAAAAATVADKALALSPIDHENPFVPAFTAVSAPAPKTPGKPPEKPAQPKSKGNPVVASLPDTLIGPAMDSVPGLPPTTAAPNPAPTSKPAKPSSPAAASRAVAKIAPAPPKPPAVLVTGILEGRENVAILKWSDTQRQVVRTGDHLDGGYVVRAIRSDAVVLANGDSEWVMRLGAAAKG